MASNRRPPKSTGGLVARAAGILLIAVPLLPLRTMFGELDGASLLVPPTEWLLGFAICLALAWLIVPLIEAARGSRLRLPGPRVSSRSQVAAGLLLLFLCLLAVSRFVFRGRPHLVDSIAQMFQAKIFASGSLVAPAPPLPEFFATQQMLIDGSSWYAQYPPGHAALLAVGHAAGAAWLVPVLLSVGTAFLLYRFASNAYDRPTALLTLVLTLVSPFFLFMGASFMNHVSALFFIALFLYLFTTWETSGSSLRAVLAGAALGGAFLSRPLTAVAIGAVFAFAAVRAGPPASWRSRTVAVTGFLAVAALYLFYNAATTGDPFVAGYLKLWGAEHGLGFHATPWGRVHTPLSGLGNELLDLSLLNLALFEWPLPALLPIGIAFAAGWLTQTWDRRLLAALLAIPAAYFFYWHRDAFLGPRFLYSSLAMLLPLTARALVVGARRLRGREIRLGGSVRPVPAATLAGATLALCAGYALLYGIPQRARVYASGLRSMKLDLAAEARAAGISEGLIFVPVSWGNRLIARLHGLRVAASLAEVAYRKVDHCRLQELVDRAVLDGTDPASVETELRELIALGEPLDPSPLNGDPTLRLRPNAELSESCVRELRRDGRGYTIFAPHLPANSPRLDAPLVLARDLGDHNAALRALYPDRPAFRYGNDGFALLH